MTPREIAAPRRFKIGDTIPAEKNGIGGEIVDVQALSDNRAIVFLRLGDGGLATMTVVLDGDSSRVLSEPVSAKDARNLALLILAGRAPRLPIETQLNILAGALLAAGEAKGESS